ncbi:hypothetical protein OHS59_01175 [Streptomyces sp. NBC_00414]|uniref:hypothetical protein n=1 Tax=Streptomyces sp. NBC_00414 TaxID=2975739 RepID=UPI002E1C8113
MAFVIVFRILDEPTGEMDPRGEHRVFHQLRERKQDRITVCLAWCAGGPSRGTRCVP